MPGRAHSRTRARRRRQARPDVVPRAVRRGRWSPHNRRVNPAPSIRRATAADATMLAEFGAETFLAAYAAQVGAAVLAPYIAETFAPEHLAAELADERGRFLIAEVDGSVAGYVVVHAGERPVEVAAERPVEIRRLYAAPAFIGRGVGSAMMRAALDAALELSGDVAWLGVWSRNARAIAFYRRWGFEVVGSVPFMLGEVRHEDLIMARPLGGRPASGGPPGDRSGDRPTG